MEYLDLFVIFCAVMLLFIAGTYAFFRVLYKHERKDHLKLLLILMGSSLAAWHGAHFVKNLIALPRPNLGESLFLPVNVNSYGFPSGHAAFMFALAATMYAFDKKAGRILYLLAIATGIARSVSGVHFWYDIVGGAILGFVISLIVVVAYQRFFKR